MSSGSPEAEGVLCCGLPDCVQQVWRVLTAAVDRAIERPGGHRPLGIGGEEWQEIATDGRLWIEPGPFLVARQDDRHPVVDLPHQLVRGGCDDRAGGVLLTLAIDPAIEEPGEGEDIVVRQCEEERVTGFARFGSSPRKSGRSVRVSARALKARKLFPVAR